MAGFEQWIDGCQARKFHYFSTNDGGGLSRSAVGECESEWIKGSVLDIEM
jgi:hypothetical protein